MLFRKLYKGIKKRKKNVKKKKIADLPTLFFATWNLKQTFFFFGLIISDLKYKNTLFFMYRIKIDYTDQVKLMQSIVVSNYKHLLENCKGHNV